MPEESGYLLREARVRVYLTEGDALTSEEKITTSESAARLIARAFANMDREYVCSLQLDTNGRPINYSIISVGTINRLPRSRIS